MLKQRQLPTKRPVEPARLIARPLPPARRRCPAAGIKFTINVISLIVALWGASWALATQAGAADAGIITKPSKYSVKETISRFEDAVKARQAAGFMVFTELDHAAAAKRFGLEMRPRTVIVFGNPKLGTPAMVQAPLLAIDVPPKALVWQDDQGKVWLSYNSADYLYRVVYPRHGLSAPASTEAFAKILDELSDYATK